MMKRTPGLACNLSVPCVLLVLYVLLFSIQAAPVYCSTLGPWQTTPSALQRPDPAMPGFVMNGFMYAFYNDSTTIQRAAQGTGGALGSWADYSNQAYKTKWGIPTVTAGNRVYAIGDWGRVFMATQSGNGNLSSWSNGIAVGDTMAPPNGRALLWGAAEKVTIGNETYLYHLTGFEYLSGFQPAFVSDCFYAKIRADGRTDPWIKTTSVTARMSPSAVAASNGFMYLLGGGVNTFEPLIGPTTNAANYARINTDGSLGSWISGRNLPYSARGIFAFESQGDLFICGGVQQGAAGVKSCYKSKLNNDGSLGSWTPQPDLPEPAGITPRGVLGNYAYIMGHRASGPVPVFVAEIRLDAVPTATTTPSPTPNPTGVMQAY